MSTGRPGIATRNISRPAPSAMRKTCPPSARDTLSSQPRQPVAEDPEREVRVGRPEVKPEQDGGAWRGGQVLLAPDDEMTAHVIGTPEPEEPRSRDPAPTKRAKRRGEAPGAVAGVGAGPGGGAPPPARSHGADRHEQAGQDVLAPWPRQEVEAEHQDPEDARVVRGPGAPEGTKPRRLRGARRWRAGHRPPLLRIRAARLWTVAKVSGVRSVSPSKVTPNSSSHATITSTRSTESSQKPASPSGVSGPGSGGVRVAPAVLTTTR